MNHLTISKAARLSECLQVMLPGTHIQPRHLPDVVRQAVQPNGSKIKCFRTELPFREAVRDFEVQFLQHILAEEGGSRTKAAKRLGISRKTLWEKLAETVTEK